METTTVVIVGEDSPTFMLQCISTTPLRRSAVRNLDRAGVSRSMAMKLTGHKTENVYRRYAIVAENDLREAGAKLAATLGTVSPSFPASLRIGRYRIVLGRKAFPEITRRPGRRLETITHHRQQRREAGSLLRRSPRRRRGRCSRASLLRRRAAV
jgi:hypothetical protein